MLIQGAMFIVFANFPGVTFIQGATSIPYSRVYYLHGQQKSHFL